jgi:hypothetical protein
MLPSLHIQGFRCFRELTIERLGRVNLIVGKNNVGKTTLLDALRVHAAQGDALYELEEILDRHGEIMTTRKSKESPKRVVNWQRAFHDADFANGSAWISIGTLDKGDGDVAFDVQTSAPTSGSIGNWVRRGGMDLPRVEVRLGQALPPAVRSSTALPCQYVPATGFPAEEAVRLWDGIVLTEHEDTCLQALRIIEPDIHRVALMDLPGPDGSVVRAPHVSRQSRRQPEPLSSLGEGMNRIFDIMLGMTNARGGRLLIDEIENGLHYSIHETLWRHMFDIAGKLDVQVFATTHSWDCIEAFQAAARAHPDEGILIRLDRRESESIAYLFDEDELAVVSDQSIEVR